MSIILLLILASLSLALCALGGFIWAVRQGQFDDTCTPSLRILTDENLSAPHSEPPQLGSYHDQYNKNHESSNHRS